MLFPKFSMKLHWILSILPSPFSMLSILDCPIDFVAATTLKWGGGVKENKDVRDRTSSLISRASQLFLHRIVDTTLFVCTCLLFVSLSLATWVCLSVGLSIYPSIRQSVCIIWSIYLPTYLAICLVSIHPTIYLSIHSPVKVCFHLFVCLSLQLHVSVCLDIQILICLSSLSVYVYIFVLSPKWRLFFYSHCD